jgi:hypothetical protein
MNTNDKGTLKTLWDMRHLTVDEFLKKLSANPELKLLLTVVGGWFVLRWVIGLWIGVHVIYFIYRIFNLVLN